VIPIVIVLLAVGCFFAYKAYVLYNAANQALVSVTKNKKATIADLLKSEKLNGEDGGVVNILVAGNSVDDANHGGAKLTDSIMVASINIKTDKVILISIPRDLWVTTDSYGSMKINALYEYGGMDLLQATVENVLGITINHQVLVNNTAFKTVVDAIGGIDIDVEGDDARGIYDPMIGLTLSNGVQHLDGATALKLARCRNDPTYDGRIAYGLSNGDFDRTMNQRKIVQAIFTKVSTTSVLANQNTLLKLIEAVGSNVVSNLSPGQIRRLYDLSKKITISSSINIRGDSSNYLLSSYESSDGQSALIPIDGVNIYTDIKAYILKYV